MLQEREERSQSEAQVAGLEEFLRMLVHEVAHEGVGKIPLESVTDFHLEPPARGIEEQQQPTLLAAPAADLHLVHRLGRRLLDRASADPRHEDEAHVDVGLALDEAHVLLEARDVAGGKDAGTVVDVALGGGGEGGGEEEGGEDESHGSGS